MAHGSREFVLFGYSEHLDRRALLFVDPIPPALICNACGIVPRLTFSLLCGHVLCEPCYHSSATTSECVCPLDGEVSGTEDVISRNYPSEILLRRKVHCWNEVNGCSVVLPASQVTEHVRNDCQYHVTRCPKCSAVVLSRDVCTHLKSQCAELVLHAAPEGRVRADSNDRTHLLVFEEKLEQRVRGLDAKLAQLSLETTSQSDRLVELCHNDSNLKEALAEQFRIVSGQTLDRLAKNEAEIKALVTYQQRLEQRVVELDAKLGQLSTGSSTHGDTLVEVSRKIDHLEEELTKFGTSSDRNVADLKAFYLEQRESFMTALTSLSTSPPSNPKVRQRVLTEYSALKRKALEDGSSVSWSEKVYLLRYLLSWGIEFRKEGDSVWLYLCIQLHEGKEDDFLEWPFKKDLWHTFIHPDTRHTRALFGVPGSYVEDWKSFERPIGGSNKAVRFCKDSLDSRVIEMDGFNENDQLLVRLEVC
ncbi:hypothetical protein HPB48_017277 [Haemaphysalis longicornis]|uniref:TRAF1-6 MATH domain-containing protein n=1 Tax=Haemaphysalis longicornis TaxID=44386 RepID=A0A9J6FRX1_HAELO|nr:hypothetical protein HPB48_017277 [Haemaphysalis longicornis]